MRTPPLSPAAASLNLPLPRPPAWIWLFTTQTGPGRAFAAASESAACNTATPREIGTPNSWSSALAWYSWMFIRFLRFVLYAARRRWDGLIGLGNHEHNRKGGVFGAILNAGAVKRLFTRERQTTPFSSHSNRCAT